MKKRKLSPLMNYQGLFKGTFNKKSLMIFVLCSICSLALAQTSQDFGLTNGIKQYYGTAKNVVMAVCGIAVLIFGVQLTISFFAEQGEVSKGKLIRFFVGLIVFFIILQIKI